jgi:hypothetical protein
VGIHSKQPAVPTWVWGCSQSPPLQFDTQILGYALNLHRAAATVKLESSWHILGGLQAMCNPISTTIYNKRTQEALVPAAG